jgi:hypothetical protein
VNVCHVTGTGKGAITQCLKVLSPLPLRSSRETDGRFATVEWWDFQRHGLKRPLWEDEKGGPRFSPGAARAGGGTSSEMIPCLTCFPADAQRRRPTPFHQPQELTMAIRSDSRQIASGRLSRCLKKIQISPAAQRP